MIMLMTFSFSIVNLIVHVALWIENRVKFFSLSIEGSVELGYSSPV